MTILTVGVIGAGQMGNGITQVCAVAGCDVVMLDVKAEAINAGMATISKNLSRLVAKGALTENDRAEAIRRVSATQDYTAFAGCNLVVEAATENENIKKAIFRDLIPHLPVECIVASNTSSISITRLASATDRPHKFIGMHFMNPVPVMKLVEIIRGIATDQATFEAVSVFAGRLGKAITVSKDFPAFLVNRVLVPMINEATFALHEGVGTVTDIDAALKLGANHPLGPLELADLIGLDTCLSIMRVLYEGFSDSKYRPCPLLVQFVEAGWLGRKSGRGFYDYTCNPPRPTR